MVTKVKPKTVIISGMEIPLPDCAGDDVVIDDPERQLWQTRRRALIMELGAIEDYLEIPRSIVPRRKREDERKAS